MIKVSLKQAIKNYVRGQLSSLGLLEDLGLEFNLPLLYSIYPAKGEPVPTFSRSTTASVTDFEGVVHTCKINEARFEGARRVENLCSDSETYATETITVFSGIDYIFAFEGSGSVTFSGAATGTLAGTGSSRVEDTITTSGTSLTITVTGEVLKAQLEKVSGTQTTASEYVSTGVSVRTGEELVINGGFDTNLDGWSAVNWVYDNGKAKAIVENTNSLVQNMLTIGKAYTVKYTVSSMTNGYLRGHIGNEYISSLSTANGTYTETGVCVGNTELLLSRNTAFDGSVDDVSVKEEYFHGAGVDGVKYFNTDRGGNLLTGVKGFLNEPESENLLTYSEEFDNIDWFKNANVTLSANDTIAPDGTKTAYKYSISDITLRNIDQGVSFTTGVTYTFSVWVKAIVDTRFYVHQSSIGWSEAFDVKASDGWVRLISTHTATISGSYAFGFYDLSGNTGDMFYIWGAQLEEGSFPTSYIKTVDTAVTRTADSLIIDNSNRDVLPNSFCLVGTWTPLGGGDDYVNADVRLFGSQDSRGNEPRTYGLLSSYDYVQSGLFFSISREDITEGIENKYAFQLFQDGEAVNAEIYKDGVQKRGETQTQTLDHSNESLEIGSWAGAAFASYIKDIRIYNKELSDSQLKRITS